MQQWVQTTWRTPSTGQLFTVLMISWTLKKVVGNKRRGIIKPRFCLQQFWHKSAQAAVYSPLENHTKTTSKRFFNHSIYSTFLNVLIKWILKLCWGIWSSRAILNWPCRCLTRISKCPEAASEKLHCGPLKKKRTTTATTTKKIITVFNQAIKFH